MTTIQKYVGEGEMTQESFVIENKRNIVRRCPVCDRGHSCFTTAADIDVQVMETPTDVAIAVGSVYRLQQNVVGSWRGVKTRIPDGTKVVVKNLRTEPSGGLRAMIELPDGDTQWISASLLGVSV